MGRTFTHVQQVFQALWIGESRNHFSLSFSHSSSSEVLFSPNRELKIGFVLTETGHLPKRHAIRPAVAAEKKISIFLRHEKYMYNRKRGSASYIVRELLSVREREIQRERDGSDVTIFALKLAMNLHFPLPKIRTISNELTLSLAKNSHFSFLPSHFPSLPSRRGHVVLKFAMSSHFPLPNLFWPSLFPSFKWHEPRDEWSKTQDKWSNPGQSYFVLPIEKMNQINTKNYWK